jgi:predicted GTPase
MKRVILIGAAGRGFHNFHGKFRDDSHFEAAAFTAAQIPDIANCKSPAALAGPRYPVAFPASCACLRWERRFVVRSAD